MGKDQVGRATFSSLVIWPPTEWDGGHVYSNCAATTTPNPSRRQTTRGMRWAATSNYICPRSDLLSLRCLPRANLPRGRDDTWRLVYAANIGHFNFCVCVGDPGSIPGSCAGATGVRHVMAVCYSGKRLASSRFLYFLGVLWDSQNFLFPRGSPLLGNPLGCFELFIYFFFLRSCSFWPRGQPSER